jgi:3',5'-cyclic AMP phosphodiesterase CpdA
MPHITLPTLSRRGFGALAAPWLVRLASAAPGDPMHWALLSDTHIPENPAEAYRNFRPVENLAKVVPEVLAANVQGALICGDLARLKGTPGDYAALKAGLAPLAAKMPLAQALGNHDDRKNFLAAFSAEPGVQKVSGKHVVVIEGPSARLVVLDSLIAPDLTPGLLGRAQRQWLAGFLANSSDLPTLLFVHHTLDDGDGSLLDVPRLFEIVRPWRKVKAVLYGHSHRYNYETWEGIHLINLPAVGYNFADNEPVGWVEARLNLKGGTFTLRSFGGNQARNGQPVALTWRT